VFSEYFTHSPLSSTGNQEKNKTTKYDETTTAKIKQLPRLKRDPVSLIGSVRHRTISNYFQSFFTSVWSVREWIYSHF
jgi:hypothetical protein